MSFTAAEQDFLRAQPIGRLSTIGPGGQPQIRPVGVHLGPDGTIDVVGHALASSPAIGMINFTGSVETGSAVLAATADFRLVCAGEAKLGISEIQVGVPFPTSALESIRYSCAGPHLHELFYRGLSYAPAAAVERRLAEADVVVCATTARKPLFDSSVLIRTLVGDGDAWEFAAGSGLTIKSDADAEIGRAHV